MHLEGASLEGRKYTKSTAPQHWPVFAAAPPLADEDIQEIAETAARRIVRLLQDRGLLVDSLVVEPRRHEPPEWRSGALELQCGASQKVYGGNLSLFSGEFGVHIHLN